MNQMDQMRCACPRQEHRARAGRRQTGTTMRREERWRVKRSSPVTISRTANAKCFSDRDALYFMCWVEAVMCDPRPLRRSATSSLRLKSQHTRSVVSWNPALPAWRIDPEKYSASKKRMLQFPKLRIPHASRLDTFILILNPT